MALEPVSTRHYRGFTLYESAQPAQHYTEIPLSGGEVVAKCGVEEDLRPVHVIKSGGEESINYRAKLMSEGRPYVVEWYGTRVALIKGGGRRSRW